MRMGDEGGWDQRGREELYKKRGVEKRIENKRKGGGVVEEER